MISKIERVKDVSHFIAGDLFEAKEITQIARDLISEHEHRLNLRDAFLRFGKHTLHCAVRSDSRSKCNCDFEEKVRELT